MGIFSSIRDTIFGKARARPAPAPAAPRATGPGLRPVPAGKQDVETLGVDVEAVLDGMPGSAALNWRTSIVDLMKLVGLDASFTERRELAAELGNLDYSGTAEDNIGLHRQLLKDLSANGGKVPASLLD